MPAPRPQEFYEAEYHFVEDAESPNLSRLWGALRHLEPLAGATFLDLGAGVGWATNLALQRGQAHLGIALDFARRPLQLGRRLTPEGRWVQGDGTALPFPAAAFDRVFSFGSMEHFPDVGLGFAELYRVLRSGGRAVVVVPNFYVRTDQPLEFRATRASWERLIRGSGLQIVTVGSDRGPAIFKNWRPVRLLLRILLRLVSFVPPLRYQFVFVLRKP
jgi:SAM-dependent methyltransferase